MEDRIKKIAAGAAIGVAVPAAVGTARKLLGNRRGRDQKQAGSSRPKSRSRSSNSSGNRTKDQLYDEAKRLKIEGRSTMTKAQLERAISRAKS